MRARHMPALRAGREERGRSRSEPGVAPAAKRPDARSASRPASCDVDTPSTECQYSADMGRRDSRRSKKMRRRKSQVKLKARTKRAIGAAKAAKKPAPAPTKKK